MRVIERYIFGRALLLSLGAFGAIFAILWITQALTRINLITTNGQSAMVFIKISLLTMPSIVPEVLPFAVAIAVAQTLVTMNTDSELAVISAAGSPRSAILRPVLSLALAAAILSFVVTNVLDPYARLEFRRMIGDARADLISTVLQEDTFSEIEDGLYIQIGERLAGGDLGGVFVADSRATDVDVVYYAKRGSLTDAGGKRLLLMQDGMIQRETPDGEVSVIRFYTYAFDLSPFGAATRRLILRPRDRTLAFLFDPDPQDLAYRQAPTEFRAELHRRLAEWSFPLVFALFALAAAGKPRAPGQNRIGPLIMLGLVTLLLRWLALVAAASAEQSAHFIPAIYGIPLGASAVAIWFIGADRTLELPATLVEKSASTLLWTRDRIARRLGQSRKLPLLDGRRGG